ncbi:hypothetical protein DL768_000068 [Monosporascus sp. mg162]|nr:hypothetical protein DL768_000068 [Monosporascus sp. mg162]
MKPIIAVPATLLLVYRAYSRKSLTPGGIFAAVLTAIAQKDVKAKLTVSASGNSGGEGPRTHVQVLSNSLMASILTLLHTYQLRKRHDAILAGDIPEGTLCYSWGGDPLVVGIIANYAAVAADTFSSELGILSRSEPRLITSLTLRKVPRGTNGGVTLWGLIAGFLGSMIIVTASFLFLPMCNDQNSSSSWTTGQKALLAWGLTIWGTLGSLLDSFLGGWFQRSVKDVRSGKIVEADGGARVLVSPQVDPTSSESFKKSTEVKAKTLGGEGKRALEKPDSAENPYNPSDRHRGSHFGDSKPTRVVENGFDLLDNNDVNFLMAFTMSIGAMAIASWYWGIPLNSVLNA